MPAAAFQPLHSRASLLPSCSPASTSGFPTREAPSHSLTDTETRVKLSAVAAAPAGRWGVGSAWEETHPGSTSFVPHWGPLGVPEGHPETVFLSHCPRDWDDRPRNSLKSHLSCPTFRTRAGSLREFSTSEWQTGCEVVVQLICRSTQRRDPGGRSWEISQAGDPPGLLGTGSFAYPSYTM